MQSKKIAIVGGGASGIFASIGAGLASKGRQGVEIIIFESNRAIGKPILRSGNGRCNLSNKKIKDDEALSLLKSRGLLTETKDTGEIFPYTNKAQTVLDLCTELLDECGVKVETEHTIDDLDQLRDFDSKIICTGHHTKEGLLPQGYDFFDFELVLCPIEVEEKDISSLNNLRAKCLVTVKDDLGVVIFEEYGEVQFREYGLSGIVIFNASRYSRQGDIIELNFKPKDMSVSEFQAKIKERLEIASNYEGIVAKEISDYLLKHGKNPESLTFTISRLHDDPKLVQVYRGGIPKKSAYDFSTMTFVCGEALDYDGPCGGFNISHAFNSGLETGRLVAEFLLAEEALRDGRAVGLPTDTVYGIGVSVKHASSKAIINEIKGSALDKPIAWLIAEESDLERYATNIPDYVAELTSEGWPGGLTIILQANDNVPENFRSSSNTVALRMPNSQLVRELARRIDSPIAASSANYSGQPALKSYADVDPSLLNKLSATIRGINSTSSGIASTIIDCTGDIPVVIRT